MAQFTVCTCQGSIRGEGVVVSQGETFRGKWNSRGARRSAFPQNVWPCETRGEGGIGKLYRNSLNGNGPEMISHD